jgi:regulator of protease activity HflC (stomatin/prohibitin superfamily)
MGISGRRRMVSFEGFGLVFDITPIILGIIAVVFLTGIKINSQWDTAVIFRLGNYSRMHGSGLYYVIPFIERRIIVDGRVRTTTFTAEQSLTRDNVPVFVDAVLFWRVKTPSDAIIVVQDYEGSILKASMTTLRDTIGRTELATMLSDRQQLDNILQQTIESKAKLWGIDVQSVEIKDVKIPKELEDAMSRQAQAERERLARISLGDSEIQIAKKFEEASRVYISNPEAMRLRAMNMLYEAVKEKGTFIIVPSEIVSQMGFSSVLGTVGFAQANKDEKKEK